jgi:hypothetical protein
MTVVYQLGLYSMFVLELDFVVFSIRILSLSLFLA